MARIVITEDVWGAAFDDLSDVHKVVLAPEAWQRPDEIVRLAATAQALIVRNQTKVDRLLIERLPALRVVGRAGVGLDNIDQAALRERGIALIVPADANARSVAEHALALALTLARRIIALDAGVRAGAWSRVPGLELHGRTWGIIGYGSTGRAVAEVVRGFGMQVIAHDPFSTVVGENVRALSLEELLSTADVVSLHIPLTDQTRGMVDMAFLDRMRSGALLINVSRGALVDESALHAALETGRLAGAGLDVRACEPSVPGAIEERADVVLTPHVAGITIESQHRVVEALASGVSDVLAGVPRRWAPS